MLNMHVIVDHPQLFWPCLGLLIVAVIALIANMVAQSGRVRIPRSALQMLPCPVPPASAVRRRSRRQVARRGPARIRRQRQRPTVAATLRATEGCRMAADRLHSALRLLGGGVPMDATALRGVAAAARQMDFTARTVAAACRG